MIQKTKRKNKYYIPPKGVIKHVDALLQMMTALTHDKGFEEASGEWKGEEEVMSEIFLDQIEERGIQKGIREGIREGEFRKLIEQVCRKMAKGKFPEVIADELEEDEMVIQGIHEIAIFLRRIMIAIRFMKNGERVKNRLAKGLPLMIALSSW